ncbi:MAG: hypothetical protein IPP27_14560 [Bacteroidetes bacterium]|nr:hypothetical protein [Bacteroidota bacterium]
MENNSSKYRHLTGEDVLLITAKQLSPQEMHRMEKHMQECSFCEEAMNWFFKWTIHLSPANIIRDLQKGRKNSTQRKVSLTLSE